MPRQNRILATTIVTLLLFFFTGINVFAQADGSQYDKGTPPQFVAGVSGIGSYTSADIGTINLANGSLNIKLPLASVGGRGFSFPLSLNYSGKLWSAKVGRDFVYDPIPRQLPASYADYATGDDEMDIFHRVGPGWSIGGLPTLRATGVGINPQKNVSTGCDEFGYVVVKLTLVLPDKGEVEFRDDVTDGAPLVTVVDPPSGCKRMDGNRGTRWHATDGSGAIFICDTTNGVSSGNLNGTVIYPDGMRYKFTTGTNNGGVSVYLKAIGLKGSPLSRPNFPKNKVETPASVGLVSNLAERPLSTSYRMRSDERILGIAHLLAA
jgi:hypothetical protein